MKPILFAAIFAIAAGSASAHEFKAGSIEIKHPWSRATPKGSEVAGGYLKLINTGTESDRLIGGSSQNAGKFEIHEMSMDGGVMKMRPLPNGIEIKPGQTVELKPGSYHLMFIGLKEPFVQGKNVKGTLQFEKAGAVDVEYAIEPVGGTPKGHEGMDHKGH
ncbi:MAG: copper chaperone PCu(A)C [Hyphomicrobiales bacterium]|nr:copper chaperone PCu(A)C [Alphaproteobacteria bacterium]